MVEIVYWSGTGNTEAMASVIEKAVKDEGKEVECVCFENTDADSVAAHDVIIMGCPAMGAEVLEETVVQPFFDELKGKLSGKKVGLFGSYGWGTGEWMENWVAAVKEAGAVFIDPAVIVNGAPEDITDCTALGKAAAALA
ncbi:flavodoxin [Megasphaera paucivorans]|uniref:Flavodoxin n=1 Tax=Megasphaera paucivorans TaxID=349095 RepID=A0A1G9VIJ3_9FIRM|nr:flavodoxin [Megasphaera paucivorans]SDM72014.1 flavodoxin, short chain [Megasphaera paucivorans]